MRPTPAIKNRKNSVAVLDIGTSKVVCFIAEPDAEGELHIQGIGHQLAKGMKCGVVTDTAELETSIVAAVHTAEKMAGATVENVIVGVSGTHLRSRMVAVESQVSGDEVTSRDVADLLREGCASLRDRERSVIHCFAAQYTLDGARGVRDPRHMYGQRLGADLHIVTADNARLRNLANCVARCHLNVAEFVVAPHAAALGCLEPDEMDLGVLLMDIGGGETTFSVFQNGANLLVGAVPIGGQHVTGDIAKGLATSLAHAERLKNLHGSAVTAPHDNQAMVEVHPIGEEDDPGEDNAVPRAVLNGIIRPRLEEIFEIIRHKLEMSGVEAQAGRHAVLTGGGSQLLGLRELVARVMGKQQVRVGRPRLIPGLADSVSGPAFSSAVGMLRYAGSRPFEDELFVQRRGRQGLGARMGRMMRWVRENF